MPETPKLIRFNPPRAIQAVKVGEVVSCDAAGDFGHGGSITNVTIETLPGLLQFAGEVKAGKMKPVIVVGGHVLEVPLWLALDLDAAVHAGRVTVVDQPAVGGSERSTEPV